ncbi:P-loop ATPase, Sll1717 family [Stenotrophomonas maltophilia]|uniref:P-loop ATPase, Sll1717 family n=1 Tax=Stenotrophomonas maltophilia TaxID=40324 RepID=UPI003CEA889F
MEFSKIAFGEISAEEELDKNPSLVMSAFYNFNDAILKISEGHEFLVLGNKGSGKSIIGEHLNLRSGVQSDETQWFVSKFGMKDFPFKSFAKIIPGDESPESKFSIAWQWALLVQSVLSFTNDSGKSNENDVEFNRAFDSIKNLGILPSTSISSLAKLSSSRNFKLKIMDFELSSEFAQPTATDLMFTQVVAHLKAISSRLQSPNKHFIVIDGLDDQLGDRNKQFSAISSLIEEAGGLNKEFRKHSVPMKIVILCRKDIYTRLPGANKNKQTGYTINLNWYEDQVDHKLKNIAKLAQFRAEISGLTSDLFSTYFQAKYGDKDPVDYLLENTRYTPRDFLKLLSEMQNVQLAPSHKISYEQIKSTVKIYSKDYFWPEIEDELDGYFDRKDISTLKKALSHFQKREFRIVEFELFCNAENYDLPKIKEMLEILYDCGAVSNTSGKGKYFSKMKDGSDFNEKQAISIHRGALKALGL